MYFFQKFDARKTGLMNSYFYFRDSDDEAEGKNKMVEIVNEVVEEEKAAAAEISAENKAAQALDKVFAGETSTTETEKSSEQMETENDDE